MIMKCTCKHTFQDELYGKGNRVFNRTRKKDGERFIYRCTVCLKEKTGREQS